MATSEDIERLVEASEERAKTYHEMNSYLKEIAGSLQGIYDLIVSQGVIGAETAKDIVVIKAKTEVMVDVIRERQMSAGEALKLERLRNHELGMKLVQKGELGVANMPALVNLILECGGFDDAGGLAAIFVDRRLARWRNGLPTEGSKREIAERVVALLGVAGMPAFLTVLRERTDRDDGCWERLGL